MPGWACAREAQEMQRSSGSNPGWGREWGKRGYRRRISQAHSWARGSRGCQPALLPHQAAVVRNEADVVLNLHAGVPACLQDYVTLVLRTRQGRARAGEAKREQNNNSLQSSGMHCGAYRPALMAHHVHPQPCVGGTPQSTSPAVHCSAACWHSGKTYRSRDGGANVGRRSGH